MVTQDDFRKAVEAEPTLCAIGLRTRNLTAAKFAKNREELLNCFDQFRDAVAFLAECKLRKSPNIDNPVGGSYYLKHAAEKWAKTYISNGALIAAVIHLGIPYRSFDDSPNIRVAISSKCPLASNRQAAGA